MIVIFSIKILSDKNSTSERICYEKNVLCLQIGAHFVILFRSPRCKKKKERLNVISRGQFLCSDTESENQSICNLFIHSFIFVFSVLQIDVPIHRNQNRRR